MLAQTARVFSLAIHIAIPSHLRVHFWLLVSWTLPNAGRPSSIQVFTFSDCHMWSFTPTSTNLAVKTFKINSNCRRRNILSEVEQLAKGKSSLIRKL